MVVAVAAAICLAITPAGCDRQRSSTTPTTAAAGQGATTSTAAPTKTTTKTTPTTKATPRANADPAKFNPMYFGPPIGDANPWLPLVPGYQSVVDGTLFRGRRELHHRRRQTVTDVIKQVDGVRTVLVLDQDIDAGQIAEQALGGVWVIDGTRPRVIGFVPTGTGAHGLYASRDSRVLYVSNRGEGSVSLVSFATGKVVATWRLPGGGSPDMGGVSADGKVLWLAGRYHGEVYAIDTSSGRLLARVPVGRGPHGLCVYPQPGRYSLGHTGVFR